MLLDGNAICYLLSRDFDDVEGYLPSEGPFVDYPLLYDETEDQSGHAVIIPSSVMLDDKANMHNVLCVCIGNESTQSALAAGFPTIHVRGSVTFQHLYNSMQFSFVGHERFDAQLHAYLNTFAGFPPLVEMCARTMGCSCALVDRRFRLIAQADPLLGGASQWTSESYDDGDIDLFMASHDYPRLRTMHRVFAMPGVTSLFMKNIFSGDELVGALVISHDGTIVGARYTRFLLNYLAPFVEEMYERIGSFDIAQEDDERIHSTLERVFAGEPVDYAAFDNVINTVSRDERALREKRAGGDGSAGGAVRASGEVGAGGAADRRSVVVCFARSFTNDGADDLGYLAHRVDIAWSYAYSVLSEGVLFAFVREIGPGFFSELAEFSRDALVKVGVSRAFSKSEQLLAARTQALAALEQGEIEQPTFWVYRFDDYALPWLVAHGQGALSAECVAHPAVLELIRYDEEHGSELVDTLRTFMECRYNATEASARLFVARSTLLNRLARIEEITSVRLDDFDERIYLELSLRFFA